MFLSRHQACKFQLMNSEPLSQSNPRNAKGSVCSTSWMAARTAAWLRPRTARDSVQVLWMSVTFRVCPNSPAPELPECETRSISVNPGQRTSQLSVLIAIWCFSSKPGLVRP
jgi:hypothetical protein